MFYKFLIQPLANGLIVFYKLLGSNLGLAIIGFSVFLRLLLDPLTRPYVKSMQKMKEYASQLDKLKEKHKDDKLKLAQAQSEFYRQKGINPGAGCLPYLLQIVILIAFFNVFTRTLMGEGDPTQKFNELLYKPLKFSQSEIVNTKFLYLDVTKPDVFRIPQIPFPIPGPILILAALIQFLTSKAMSPSLGQQKKMAQKTVSSADDIQTVMQQSMVYTFPLLTLFFGMTFPSGLAIYWLLFSVWQFFQQSKTSTGKEAKVLPALKGLIKSSKRQKKDGK